MKKIKINKKNISQKSVKRISSTLADGKVVIMPTDTVYIFAVDARNSKAIETVYKLKERDLKNPIHVNVDGLKMAEKYAVVTEKARLLAKHFLPGPLTLILNKLKGTTPDALTGGLSTLGVRIPDMFLNILVSKEFGYPYTTTSANRSGDKNTYSLEDVLQQLTPEKIKKIGLAVDYGQLPASPPSTIIDLSSERVKILRHGPVLQADIEEVLGLTLE